LWIIFIVFVIVIVLVIFFTAFQFIGLYVSAR